MTTPEQRLQLVIGQQAFHIALLESELEKRNQRIAELENQTINTAQTMSPEPATA